jgi:CRP-like cAMP-binding protein
VIFRNRILLALNESDLAALSAFMVEVTLAQGEVVYAIGQPVTHVYFPSSAVLSVITAMADGRAVESSTVGYEGGVGILPALSGDVARNRVFAQIAGGAVRIPVGKLVSRALESPILLRLLSRAVQKGVDQAEQSVACNALHDVTQRLCRWLLMTHDRVGGPILLLTQEYLSIMLGVQRTTVSIAAGALRENGMIRYSRGQIEILDRAALERAACECYGVLSGLGRRTTTGAATPYSEPSPAE